VRAAFGGRRGLVAALVASLAVNAALVGYGVGDRLADRRAVAPAPAADGGPALSPAAGRLLADMPPESRAAFRAALRQRLPEIRRQVAALRESRAAVAGLLAEPTLDEAALSAALADLRGEAAALQAVLHGMVESVAPTLTPADRRAFAERWERLPRDLGPGAPMRPARPQPPADGDG